MALLSDADRAALWGEFMGTESALRELSSVTKADLRAAFDALDGWLDANAAAANQAIPQPARNALGIRQKALILSMVIHRRFLAGS